MLWNWLTEVLRSKSKARGRDGHASPKRRPRLLELELLETRVMPIVQGIPGAPILPVAPGGPFDGVVAIFRPIPGGGGSEPASGSLLYDHSDILTAAHVVAGGTLAQKVTFNLIRQNDPGVGMGVAVPVNITLTVPANGGSNQFQKTALGYVPQGSLPGSDLT